MENFDDPDGYRDLTQLKPVAALINSNLTPEHLATKAEAVDADGKA